jgi:hypothetical protein
MPRSLIVEILGNATGFSKELDKAAGKTQKMGKIAGVAGLAIAGGLAYGLEKSVKAASEAQVSTAKMDTAFQASGQSAKDFSSQISGAEDSSRKLGFSNIDVRDSLGGLEVATHSGTAAVKDLSVAEDVARFKHIGLSDATKVLTMTMAGSTRAAHMLGIQTITVTTAQDKVRAAYESSKVAFEAASKSTSSMTVEQKKQYGATLLAMSAKEKDNLVTAKLKDKQEQAKQVIGLVSDKLKGQADAYSHTAAGGMAQMKAQTEAIEENLGSALLPALSTLSQLLANATGWLAKHTTTAKILVVALAGLAAVLMAVSVASKIAAAAETLLDVAMDANPIVLLVAALAVLVVGLVYAYEHCKTFRDIVQAVFHFVTSAASSVLGFFQSQWKTIAILISGPFAPLVALATNAFGIRTKLEDAFRDVKNWVSGHWPEIATIISGPFAPLVALATGAFGIRAKLSGAWDAIKSDARSFAGALGGLLSSGFRAAVDVVIGDVNLLIRGIDAIHLPAVGFSIFGHHVGFSGWGGFNIPQIPMLAAGGIATSPMLAMIGEAGPEAVVPLSRMPSGGVTVHVHVGPVHGTADAHFARALGQELATQLRGNRAPQLQQAIQAIA